MGINSSLTSLGKVIKELGDGVRHISYRDSVLTMLLKSSFGGRSATSVVINVAGDEEYVVYMCARVGFVVCTMCHQQIHVRHLFTFSRQLLGS